MRGQRCALMEHRSQAQARMGSSVNEQKWGGERVQLGALLASARP